MTGCPATYVLGHQVDPEDMTPHPCERRRFHPGWHHLGNIRWGTRRQELRNFISRQTVWRYQAWKWRRQ